MSVLEIILYSLIGAGFLIWVGITIYEWKHPEAKAKRKKKDVNNE